MAQLIDLRPGLVARPLGFGQLALQLVDLGKFGGVLTLQLFASLHDLQKRILQAGLAPLQRLQLMLQVGELLGVHGARRQHRPVAILTLTDRVDLGLELGHLRVKVFELDLHSGEAVILFTMRGLRLLELLLRRQILGPVLDAAQLCVELRKLEQRTLLNYFSFHVSFLSTFHGSVRIADTRTGSASPKWLRSTSAAWVHQGYSLAQCATSTSATSDARLCSSAGWGRRSAGAEGRQTAARTGAGG